MVCLIRKTAVACGLGIVLQVCMCWRVCVGEGAKVGREGGRVEKGREGGRERGERERGREEWRERGEREGGRERVGGKGRKKKEGRGREGGKEGGWLPGSCFLPGRATPSGGVGVGERLQSLSQRGREGEREGWRGTGEEESGGMLYHSLT